MLAIGAMLTAGCAQETRVLQFWIAPDPPPVPAAPGDIVGYEQAVHTITGIMVRELDIPLSGPLTVFVYPTRQAYADGLVSTGGLAPEQAAKIAEYSIAVTEHGRLFINDEDMRDLPRSAWLAMIAHELAHHAQYQLSGGRRGRSEQWLREGMADWVACQVSSAWAVRRSGTSTTSHFGKSPRHGRSSPAGRPTWWSSAGPAGGRPVISSRMAISSTGWRSC